MELGALSDLFLSGDLFGFLWITVPTLGCLVESFLDSVGWMHWWMDWCSTIET